MKKSNAERNDGCISSGLPQNMCGETILNAKGNNKKLSFQKEFFFVCSGHNLFHMRNEKEENPTWNISKCGGVYPKFMFLLLKWLK